MGWWGGGERERDDDEGSVMSDDDMIHGEERDNDKERDSDEERDEGWCDARWREGWWGTKKEVMRDDGMYGEERRGKMH